MAKSLRKVINENGGTANAIQLLELYGYQFFCQKYKYSSFTAEKWINEQPGYENRSIYSFSGRTQSGNGDITANDLVREFAEVIKNYAEKCQSCKTIQEAKIVELNEKIAELKTEIQRRHEIDRGIVKPFFEATNKLRAVTP